MKPKRKTNIICAAKLICSSLKAMHRILAALSQKHANDMSKSAVIQDNIIYQEQLAQWYKSKLLRSYARKHIFVATLFWPFLSGQKNDVQIVGSFTKPPWGVSKNKQMNR